MLRKIKTFLLLLLFDRRTIRSAIVNNLLHLKLFNRMNDEQYLKIMFYLFMGIPLNLDNPVYYSEKLQWLKINDKRDIYSQLVDKYEVRKYIKEAIGEQYLIPLIRVYNYAEEIKLNDLPDKFVLKCTHDSGSTVICTNKQEFNIKMAKRTLNKKLKKNLFFYAREYPYKSIQPRIICETLIGNGCQPPMDFKFLCFDGAVKYIVVDVNRFSDHRRNIYDLEWNKLDIITDHPMYDFLIDKPKQLSEMIDVSNKLAQGFKHIRVDLYVVNDKIFFGELTLFPWAGLIDFKPKKWNKIFGDLISLEN